jgi:hypothetical protein
MQAFVQGRLELIGRRQKRGKCLSVSDANIGTVFNTQKIIYRNFRKFL